MTLLARLTRLLKADLHGILDGLEEPEEVVKQAIRDMEEEIAKQEHTLGESQAALQRLDREAETLAASMQEVERQIDLCFTAGNESLTKSLIRKRLETARRAQGVARAREETRARSAALSKTIAEHKTQLAAVVQKLTLYTDTRPDPGWASPSCSPLQGSHITDDEVEVAFLEEQRRRNSPGQVRA